MLLFYLELWLVYIYIDRFVDYTPVKCHNNVVQSTVNARREGDENPNSSVFEKTLKLLANNSYGYQIMDSSHDSITRYMIAKNTHAAINKKKLKGLGIINNQLYEE